MQYATYDDVLDVALIFSASQGFYSRLRDELIALTDDERQDLNERLKEDKVKKDTISIILWLEQGE